MFTEAHNLDCLLQFWCYIWIENKKIQNEQEMSHHVTTVEGWGGLVNGRQGVSYSQTLHSKQFSSLANSRTSQFMFPKNLKIKEN